MTRKKKNMLRVGTRKRFEYGAAYALIAFKNPGIRRAAALGVQAMAKKQYTCLIW